jgi:hypothetical protein
MQLAGKFIGVLQESRLNLGGFAEQGRHRKGSVGLGGKGHGPHFQRRVLFGEVHVHRFLFLRTEYERYCTRFFSCIHQRSASRHTQHCQTVGHAFGHEEPPMDNFRG